MEKGFLGVDPQSLTSLSATAATSLFQSLLWCAVRAASIPVSNITISLRTDVADGGVDAEIAPNSLSVQDELLLSGNTSFQLKAGNSAQPWQKAWVTKELFGQARRPAKTALGSAVRHCLGKKGRYVLVCFGCDPTPAQRRNARRNLESAFRACGYKHPRVDVWGQSTLIGLLQPFPSLALRLANRDELAFQSIESWREQAHMQKPLHLGPEQQKLIQTTRECLRGSSVRHVRLLGEPGVGKTRLVLEAVSVEDLAPAVIYVRDPDEFQRSRLLNALLRHDDRSSMILVIDDCPDKECAPIWNALRSRSERIRLVTLDHGPSRSSDEWMRRIDCPRLDGERIKAILSEYVASTFEAGRWAEFCEGSPRVAHAVGDNLRRNPEDILKSPVEVPIWQRFVHGNSATDGFDAQQKDTVLRHIALFHKFGFEKPVQAEAEFIATLVSEADPAITWPRFQAIVNHYREQRVLQGTATLFLVPRLLHVHLWREYWRNYGTGADVADLLKRMPDSLFRWFAEMFKYGHDCPACLQEIERLTAPGGAFDDPSFLAHGKGTRLLNEMSEAHPEAVLTFLERATRSWSPEQVNGFADRLMDLVWALEKIAIWRQLFGRAANVLLRLGCVGSSGRDSQAASMFCELFAMGFDTFATSEASPLERLPVLRDALRSEDIAVRNLAVKALAQALADHPHSKMVGPEHQGVRPLPKLWAPRTWDEVHAAYRAAWILALEHRRRSQGEERGEIGRMMITAAFAMIQCKALEDDMIAFLGEVVAEQEFDLRGVVGMIAWYRRRRWSGLARKAATALRALEARIEGDSLETQIRRTFLLGTWNDLDRGEGDAYGKKHREKVRKLGKEALLQPEVLRRMLPELLSKPGFALGGFGEALADHDPELSWWQPIAQVLVAARGAANIGLPAGYLDAVFRRAPERWEAVAFERLAKASEFPLAVPLIISSGLTERVLDAICNAVVSGTAAPDSLAGLGWATRWPQISLYRWMNFIEWCVGRDDAVLVCIALDVAHWLFCHGERKPAMPEQPILALLTSPHALDQGNRREAEYQWADLAERYGTAFPDRGLELLRSVLEHFGDGNFAVYQKHSLTRKALLPFIRRNPRAAWQVIVPYLEPLHSRRSGSTLFWLGPAFHFDSGPDDCLLSLFDVEDVFGWVERDPAERACEIARACPKTLDPAAGGEVSRQLLIRYSNLDHVASALSCNFATEGSSGKRSEHYTKKRDRMRQWLQAEREGPVIRWIESQIASLNEQIKDAVIDEERRY